MPAENYDQMANEIERAYQAGEISLDEHNHQMALMAENARASEAGQPSVGAGEDASSSLAAYANNPAVSDQDRAIAVAAMKGSEAVGGGALGAALGGFGAVADYAAEAGRRISYNTGGISGAIGAPLVFAREAGKAGFELPGRIAAGAVEGLGAGLPGQGPQPVEIPPQVQPSDPPPPQGPPATAPVPQGQIRPMAARGSVRAGASGTARAPGRARGDESPGITRDIKDLEARHKMFESTQMKSGQLYHEAVGDSKISHANMADIEAEAAGQMAEQHEMARGTIKSEITRRKAAMEEQGRVVERLNKQHELAIAVQKYGHRMDEADIASNISTRESKEGLLEGLKAQEAGGEPLSKEDRSRMETLEMEISAIDRRLSRAARPDGMWHEDEPGEIVASVAMSLGSGIAKAMGAYASAITGTPNYAMQVAKERAKRNIDRKRLEMSKRAGAANSIREQMGLSKEQFEDREIFEAMNHQMELMKMKSAIEQIAMSSQSAVLQENAQLKIAEIDKEAAMYGSQIAARNYKIAGEQADRTVGARTAKASIAAQKEQARLRRYQIYVSKQMALAKGEMDRGQYDIGDWKLKDGRQPPRDKQFDKAIEYAINEKNAQHLVSELIGHRKSVGTYVAGTPEFAEAEAKLSRLINVLKAMEGMGANFTLMEKELLVRQTADSISDWGFVSDRLASTSATMGAEARNRMGVYGYEKAAGQQVTERPAMK